MCGGPSIQDAIKAQQDAAAKAKADKEAADALNPLNQPTPDTGDAVEARLRMKQRIQMLSGYRRTFVTGPRGPGGPTLEQQDAQINKEPATPADSPSAPAPAAASPAPPWWQNDPEETAYRDQQQRQRERNPTMPKTNRF